MEKIRDWRKIMRGKKFNPIRNILLWIGVLSIVLFAIFKFDAYGEVKIPVTLENCTPGTWVGMVKWNHDRTDFEILTELGHKATGTKIVMLEPGEYGITHFRPYTIEIENGEMTEFTPSIILEYRDVIVSRPSTLSFGCDEVEL